MSMKTITQTWIRSGSTTWSKVGLLVLGLAWGAFAAPLRAEETGPPSDDQLAIMSRLQKRPSNQVAKVTLHPPRLKALLQAFHGGSLTAHQALYVWSIADRRTLPPAVVGTFEKGRWRNVRLTTYRVTPVLLVDEAAPQFAMLDFEGTPVPRPTHHIKPTP